MDKEVHQNAESEAINLMREEDKFILKPSDLGIVWIEDSRYWRISSRSSSTEDSNNVEEVAELIKVAWFELTGSVMLQPSISYQITFKLSFKEDAFGWVGSQVFLMAKIGAKGRQKWKRLKELEKELPRVPTEVPSKDDPFVVGPLPEDLPDKRLYIGLYEVWSNEWKGGLNLHEAIVKKMI